MPRSSEWSLPFWFSNQNIVCVPVHFWVVMLCGIVVGYQCFSGPCCLHLQGEVTGNPSLNLLFDPGIEPLLELMTRS